MGWKAIRQKLQDVVVKIRKDKVIDAATAALIEEIPFVGGFLGKYWESIDGDADATKSMAAFIEVISSQEKAFNNLSGLVEAQGQQLIEQNVSLGQILGQIGETSNDVKAIKSQISSFIEVLQVPSAKAAFEAAATINYDTKQSSHLLERAENVLKLAGGEADAHSFYQLGMAYLSVSNFKHSEACLLKAVEMRGDLADALFGLAMIYQRQATEHLQKENYGLANEAAKKSEGYINSAALHNLMDQSIRVHLGYFYKDLAQCYVNTAKQIKAQEAFDKAWNCFDEALKLDPYNASVHNGLGSLCIVKHDYAKAITYCRKAIEINPDYLFAHFDLTQVYYVIAMQSDQIKVRLQAIENSFKAYMNVIELDGAPGGDTLPPHAREAIDGMFQKMKALIPELKASLDNN